MTTQNNDFSQLLSFDKTITSKLSRAVFNKGHSCTDNRAFSKIECVEYIWSQVFLLLSRMSVKRALEILSGPVSTGKVNGRFEKRYSGTGKVSC